MGEYINSPGCQDHISCEYPDKPDHLQTHTALDSPENPFSAKNKKSGSTKNITGHTGHQVPAMKPRYQYHGQQIVHYGSCNGCRLHFEKAEHPHYFNTCLLYTS